MKNKLRKPKCISAIGGIDHLLRSVASFGAIVLMCASASAQNLFVSGGNSVNEFTPNGAETTFASGLTGGPLVFDEAGNLFVADRGRIVRFTPYGVRSTFASGLDGPYALAFDSAGNLFVTSGSNIDKFTPQGGRSTVVSGLDGPFALAIDT